MRQRANRGGGLVRDTDVRGRTARALAPSVRVPRCFLPSRALLDRRSSGFDSEVVRDGKFRVETTMTW
jgi:hypothetical protein